MSAIGLVISVVKIVMTILPINISNKLLLLHRGPSALKHQSRTHRKQDIIQAMVILGINGILKLTQADKVDRIILLTRKDI